MSFKLGWKGTRMGTSTQLLSTGMNKSVGFNSYWAQNLVLSAYAKLALSIFDGFCEIFVAHGNWVLETRG